jgi:hypothetical protein
MPYKAAITQRVVQESARLERDAQRQADNEDRRVRRERAEAKYIDLATQFRDTLVADGFHEAKAARLRRRKKPLFGSQTIKMMLVIVEGAGSLWYRVGENLDGPKSAHPRDLLIGQDIPPIITGCWGYTEPIPYEIYKHARSSPEPIVGLKEVFDRNGALGQEPEAMVDLLVKALASWAATNRPELKLNVKKTP